MTFPATYVADGVRTDFTFDFPYLDRSDVYVTVNEVARSFTFLDSGTLRCVDSFGNPFAKGLPLVISRATPDLITLAQFVDASKLTADDLNRARLQLLFLIQERSGGMAGSVGTVISTMSNDIETISGALSSIATAQGTLTSGLSTLASLSSQITAQANQAAALQAAIDKEVSDRDAATSSLVDQMNSLTTSVNNKQAAMQSQVQLLTSNDLALASQVSTLTARITDAEDALDNGDTGDDDELTASLINSAIASATQDYAQAQQITTLSATLNDTVMAEITTEQTARVDGDKALADQITTLQTQVNDNLAQVIQEMSTEIDVTNGKVTNLEAQYTLKVAVTRDDGQVVVGGIGLSATASDDYVGSKIALMADAVVFADPNNTNGALVPFLEAGLVDGAATLVIPSTVVGDQTLPGRVIVDGSIEGQSIAANTITGDNIKAGTVTADKLDVSYGVNLLKQSTFVSALDGWTLAFQGAGLTTANQVTGVDNAGYFPVGDHAAYIHSLANPNDTNIDTSYVQLISDLVTVSASGYYEASAYVGTVNGAIAQVGIGWYDENSALISMGGFDATGFTMPAGTATGGQALTSFYRIGGILSAPVNAAAARLFVRKNLPANTDNWLYLTEPMLAETSASATRLSAYTPSGLGTLITPEGISTPSLSALSATIGLLRTATSGARTEIEDNVIRVYDGNNVLRVRMGVW